MRESNPELVPVIWVLLTEKKKRKTQLSLDSENVDDCHHVLDCLTLTIKVSSTIDLIKLSLYFKISNSYI